MLDLADGRGGNQLKARKYLQDEYAGAERGSRIGSISARARVRLARLQAPASASAPTSSETGGDGVNA